MSRFERPIEDYTEEELMQEYDTLLKVYDLACKNGYEPERYTKESYRNLLLANLETVDAFEGRDGEANLAYKQNIEAAAKAAGLSFDEYVDEVMIPYIKVWYAKEALQSYYFKKIYFGKFKEMNRTEKELYDKWEETQTSEDMNAWLDVYKRQYPVRLPFVPTTRWQGTMIEIPLCPTAPPTACADIRGRPLSAAICFAIPP